MAYSFRILNYAFEIRLEKFIVLNQWTSTHVIISRLFYYRAKGQCSMQALTLHVTFTEKRDAFVKALNYHHLQSHLRKNKEQLFRSEFSIHFTLQKVHN